MSTGEIVRRSLRYELMPVSMFVLSSAEKIKLLILRPARHTGVLLFHRAMSVRDGKSQSRAILVFFGLDPAPPSFRHARPRVRRPSGLDSSVSGTRSVVPDLFWKNTRQEKGGTFPLAVCENKRAEIDGILVGKGNIFLSGSTSAALGKCAATLFRVDSHYRKRRHPYLQHDENGHIPKSVMKSNIDARILLIPHRPTVKLKEETYAKEQGVQVPPEHTKKNQGLGFG